MRDGFQTIRINFLGGIASPGELRDLLLAMRSCEVSRVRFGLRQQLLFRMSVLHEKNFSQRMKTLNQRFSVDKNTHPNIVSSYVSEEVFQTGNWLSEGIYKDVFDSFDRNPELKVNISDAEQSFTPFFSGHINFISSAQANFWHLYVRKPKTNSLLSYDKLIFSNEIGAVSAKIEENILNGNSDCFEDLVLGISSKAKQTLKLPKFSLPYYEGFNRYGKKSWLGIYKRDEYFSISFLIDLCTLCINTKIGEICLSPWKSIIVKNINEKDRKKWSALLAQHDINVRHAANELNWQVEDNSTAALKLKMKLARYFNKKDLRTFGICLGIKTLPKTEVFASILVTQRSLKALPIFKVYDITYTTDYDPNGREVAFYAKSILPFQLKSRLRKSILEFNTHIAGKPLSEKIETPDISERPSQIKTVQQCPNCLAVYDPEFGDILNDISPGVPFEELPTEHRCPICETEKQAFKIISLELAQG
ncbi:rubredoxin [Marinilongibacter aquaticus]|uniref:rubredoxin n=1 Tax=Marinilongibacter aquaticus TaxID=2975157 RepID=UPI0021BDEBB0|nr:rubredoxin [Marinilongibacter aquaticus]UBM57354.1 rubredoxin [Marinilongibacter aquaticus]